MPLTKQEAEKLRRLIRIYIQKEFIALQKYLDQVKTNILEDDASELSSYIFNLTETKRTEEYPNLYNKTGVVKWFNDSKGWGFISQDDNGPDVFVHFSQIIKKESQVFLSLTEGEEVTYDLVDGPKGLTANNVRSE